LPTNTHTRKWPAAIRRRLRGIAILDPALTVSQPPRVTACTGIDAISHAVESAVTRKRNPLSLMYSHEAFKLCVRSFPRVLSHPNDLESRGRMLLGAAFAGMAIENSLLGAAHAAANPLTAQLRDSARRRPSE
jgi:alcohol dehydrogenase